MKSTLKESFETNLIPIQLFMIPKQTKTKIDTSKPEEHSYIAPYIKLIPTSISNNFNGQTEHYHITVY